MSAVLKVSHRCEDFVRAYDRAVSSLGTRFCDSYTARYLGVGVGIAPSDEESSMWQHAIIAYRRQFSCSRQDWVCCHSVET
jgi:hypothetical protein